MCGLWAFHIKFGWTRATDGAADAGLRFNKPGFMKSFLHKMQQPGYRAFLRFQKPHDLIWGKRE